jgi:hypothetical protein
MMMIVQLWTNKGRNGLTIAPTVVLHNFPNLALFLKVRAHEIIFHSPAGAILPLPPYWARFSPSSTGSQKIYWLIDFV